MGCYARLDDKRERVAAPFFFWEVFITTLMGGTYLLLVSTCVRPVLVVFLSLCVVVSPLRLLLGLTISGDEGWDPKINGGYS